MPATAGSIRLNLTPSVQYLLRIADTCLVHAQRQAEWCGHGPVLEEDIAITNLTLDIIGQARALLTHAATLEGQGRREAFSEDQLAFLRDERQFFNLTLVEQPGRKDSAHSPGGDFADLVVRNLLLSTWLLGLWQRLVESSDAQVAAIAAKALKEARYHHQHAADWALRLGDGTAESASRMQAALDRAWPFVGEMFASDAVDDAAATSNLGPTRASLRQAWRERIDPVLADAHLQTPPDTPFLSTGTLGVHSEHMGFILAEMQSVQRQFPGGRW
jgi:ring-1,2-phenylacetyl-CoA epoxidase subunit PaaC